MQNLSGKITGFGMNDDFTRIRKNWADTASAHDIVGTIFYTHLFKIAPDTRPLFPESLDAQGRKLVQTLSWILDHLDEPDDLVPAAENLARRHVVYGVTADQYEAVGAALISTLHEGLGDKFSKEDEAAWTRVYAHLSGLMIGAAYPEAV